MAPKNKEKRQWSNIFQTIYNISTFNYNEDNQRNDGSEEISDNENCQKKISSLERSRFFILPPMPEKRIISIHPNTLFRYSDIREPIITAGNLVKQANHFKTWRERYMVLRGHSLFYYIDFEVDSHPKGLISLLDIEVELVDINRFNREFCFEIKHARRKSLFLIAPNEDKLHEWLKFILAASLRRTKDGNALYIEDVSKFLYSGFPALKDLPQYHQFFQFRRKIAFCRIIIIPSDVEMTTKEFNRRKKGILMELVSYSRSHDTVFNETMIRIELIDMIFSNLQREFPNIIENQHIYIDQEEGKNTCDVVETYSSVPWDHLSLIYDLLSDILLSTAISKADKRNLFTQSNVTSLIYLFQTPCIEERRRLKSLLHCIYSKVTNRRTLIRQQMQYKFLEYIYESSTSVFGIYEMLEILASVINGFLIPLKEEHDRLLKFVLIPLHKGFRYEDYAQALTNCMIQYCLKESSYSLQIIHSLLIVWPIGNSKKELLFLSELEDLLSFIEPSMITIKWLELLCIRLSICIESHHFQIAERILCFWRVPHFTSNFLHHETFGKILCKKIYRSLLCAQSHWCINVRELAREVIEIYSEKSYVDAVIQFHSNNTRND